MKLLYGTELKRFLNRAKKANRPKRKIVFILHDVEYPVNVGSIFRLADACGVKEIYLSGITPLPTTPKIKKVSRGKVKFANWKKVKNLEQTLGDLKKRGYQVCALEITNLSKNYGDYQFPNKVCLVVGHEDHGIPNKVLKHCDFSVFIPMFGKGRSLNVHVALAVVAYYLQT
jgi:tRNA (guanosine-2'-O-)-methyltransferase